MKEMETQEEFAKRHAKSRIIWICGIATVITFLILGFWSMYGG